MDSPDQPDSLSTTLREWRVQPPVQPEFRMAVWGRISRTQDSLAAYIRLHRRMVALAALAVMTLAGWSGHAAAQAKVAADREAMVVTYLVELDPRVQAKLRP